MTKEELIVTAASGAAVLVLIFLAWALGFRDAARLTSEDDVRRAIADYEPAAAVQTILLDKSGRAALARLDTGKLVSIRAMADSLAVRDAAAAKLTRERFGVRVSFPDIGHPRVDLKFDGAPPVWLNAFLDAK